MTFLTLLRDTPVRDPNRRESAREHCANAAMILELAVEAARPLTWDETVAVRARLLCALETK